LLTDSYGREIKTIELNSSGFISSKIPKTLENTWFLQYNLGRVFIIICLVMAIVCFFFRKN
jgi:apolipoprotein N-acyltransferase